MKYFLKYSTGNFFGMVLLFVSRGPLNCMHIFYGSNLYFEEPYIRCNLRDKNNTKVFTEGEIFMVTLKICMYKASIYLFLTYNQIHECISIILEYTIVESL